MINPKNLCISACIGFFLSFFIGLISDVRFSRVLMRAFLFALIFALLCIGITFLYQKFLSNDNGGFSADAEPAPQRTAGGVVNIVVDDSNLADDGMSPKFTVLNNHTGLSENAQSGQETPAGTDSEVKVNPSPEAAASHTEPKTGESSVPLSEPLAQEEKSSFKPVALGDVAGGASASPAAVQASSPQPSQTASSVSAGEEQLDELPDVNSMSLDDAGEAAPGSFNGSDEVETDTEFSRGGKSMKEQPISGDTSVMAKAIQTLLSKDN